MTVGFKQAKEPSSMRMWTYQYLALKLPTFR